MISPEAVIFERDRHRERDHRELDRRCNRANAAGTGCRVVSSEACRGSGFGASKRPDERRQHSLGILENIVVPESQDAESMIDKPPISCGIGNGSRVLPTINLDNEAHIEANEVCDIWTNRYLATKLYSAQPSIPQCEPKLSLRISHI
jgi:hypothetical protein